MHLEVLPDARRSPRGRPVVVTTLETNVKHLPSVVAVAALLSACGGNNNDDPARPAGVVDQFEVVSNVDAYGGATPAGAAGPYTVITGIVHGKLDPKHPDNAGIVDLGSAPNARSPMLL